MAAEALLDFRRRKDDFFASGRGPVRGAALESFTGLSYYPPDEELIFELPLLRSAGDSVTLDTSTGETRQMAEFATVTVPFPDGAQTLTLYAQPGEDAPQSLFLPFRDATSGSESYGAGRYLDAPVTELAGGEGVRLDFNLAYHPYCAYGDGWTCPLPPAQNWLKVAVRAGEKLA
ncbi:DUF1684 domain-containing protein [Deinococcus sp. KNUC1210]|uniref:DUF1684 domain-containing protein n=1 Tax=Deinococcus sp. KNUC1210 TaxID=2917691 RepID=UPI001EF0AA3B|nr:DUF1684 domain-containing protein [Deinococcus sp. KNUC1210]ULH16325.1 DUF1684 domain-containing protein [Deinococcus sp. KNUC1210]